MYSILASTTVEQVAERYRPLIEEQVTSLQEKYSKTSTIRLMPISSTIGTSPVRLSTSTFNAD